MRRPPNSMVSRDGVQDCQGLSHARHQGHLPGLARCEQPLVESLDAGVVTRANQHGGEALENTGGFEDYQGNAQLFELPEELTEPIFIARNARKISRREDGYVQIANASSGTLARATVRAHPEVSTSAAVMAVTMAARAPPRPSLAREMSPCPRTQLQALSGALGGFPRWHQAIGSYPAGKAEEGESRCPPTSPC
jgi:hypothetical protein